MFKLWRACGNTIRKQPDGPLACNLKDFLPYDIFYDAVNHLYPENSICSTIEGQIVFIADEIARRSHDLDDALSAGLLNMNNLMDTLSLKKLHAPKLEIEVLPIPLRG